VPCVVFVSFLIVCRNFITAKFISKVVSVSDTGISAAINSEKISPLLCIRNCCRRFWAFQYSSKHIQTFFGKSLWRTGVILYIFELIKIFDKFVLIGFDNIARGKFIRIIFNSLIFFSGFHIVNPCHIAVYYDILLLECYNSFFYT